MSVNAKASPDHVQLGSITVFTNASRDGITITEEIASEISMQLAKYFTDRMKEKGIEGVTVSKVETRIGCVITTLILVAVAASGGAWTFLSQYKDAKEGLIELANDFKKLWVKLTQKKSTVPTKTEVDIYTSIPDEYKKYYSAGQDTVIITKTEIITFERTALMREDIKELPEKEEKKDRKSERKGEKKKKTKKRH